MSDWPCIDVKWPAAVRILRSRHPPIDLFEDIADPADWALLANAEMKTNPRLVASIGRLDLVPVARCVSGPGASWLMAPFVHVSPDRPSRFSAGDFGVLYAADRFEVALMEVLHHHARFMRATAEPAGWTSQFRELKLGVEAELTDLCRLGANHPVLAPDSYEASQRLAQDLRAAGGDGVVYPSVRLSGGTCVGLFYPDLAKLPVQGRHLDVHWDGGRVDLVRDAGSREVFRVTA